MRKSSIFVAVFILSMLLISNASAFSLSSEDPYASVCIGSTKVLSTLVSGSGSFTVAQDGTAASFSTTVPDSFSTEESQNVYSYITPSSKATPGSYALNINIGDGAETKMQSYEIKVKDCPKTEFTVESMKLTCPCQKTTFLLNVRNNADYSESFTLSVEGTLKEWINLSESSFSLASDEEKQIEASIGAPCNIHGKYDLNFKLKPAHYFSFISAKSVMDIQPCYEYSIGFEDTEYSLCENDALSIPLSMINQGTSNNSFKINVDGPKWVNYESQASLAAGEEKSLNFSINPPYGTVGNFTIKVDSLSDYGQVNKKAEFLANVAKCYGLSAYFSNKEETICDANREYSYPLIIKNSGKFDENVNISLEGPSWASLESANVDVKSNESTNVNVMVKFPSDIEAKEYPLKLSVTNGLLRSEDTLTVKAASTDECYSPKLTLESDSVEVGVESSKTLPIELKNNGIEESTLIISLDGDATSFSMMNPSMITLKPGKSEKLYLYISPQIFAEQKEYTLNIEARIKDSKIVSSENLKIKVVGEGQETDDSEAKEETSKEGFFSGMLSKIKAFFSTLKSNAKMIFAFNSTKQTAENKSEELTVNTSLAIEESDATEIADVSEPAAEEVNVSVEVKSASEAIESDVPEDIEDETLETSSNETLELVTPPVENQTAEKTENKFSFKAYFAKIFKLNANATVNETAKEEVQLQNTMSEAVVNETSNETKEGFFSSLFKSKSIESKTVAEANASEVIVNETIESVNETVETSESIETAAVETKETIEPANETQDVTEPQDESPDDSNITNPVTVENAKKSLMNFSAWKSYLIAGVSLILIIIIFATGFWRKIIDFFDDE